LVLSLIAIAASLTIIDGITANEKWERIYVLIAWVFLGVSGCLIFFHASDATDTIAALARDTDEDLVECPLNLAPCSFGVLIALEGKDMIGYGKTEEAFS
jgi:hypothetical protein